MFSWICARCGQDNRPSATTCVKCGARFDEPAEEPAAEETEELEAEPEPEPEPPPPPPPPVRKAPAAAPVAPRPARTLPPLPPAPPPPPAHAGLPTWLLTIM